MRNQKTKRTFLVTSLSLLMLIAAHEAYASEAIAVWAYPDSVSVPYRDSDNQIIPGSLAHIGVVAYHASGIDRVEFGINGQLAATIAEETINPETNEYEYVFILDPDTLIADGAYTITAAAYPNIGEVHLLPDLFIQKDTAVHNVWYVDSVNGIDSAGVNGSSEEPFATIHYALTRSESADMVLVKDGIYDFFIPSGSNYGFSKYTTIKSYAGALVTIVRNPLGRASTLRENQHNFIKFEGIHFNDAPVTIYSHHVWFKNCFYGGLGKIWFDKRTDAFYASRNASYLTVENVTVYETNNAFNFQGLGNYIFRNLYIYNMAGDGPQFIGNNILISGSQLYDIYRTPAWSVSRITGPYNFGNGMDLVFYLSTDKGSNYNQVAAVTLLGSLGASEISASLNADPGFASNFIAVLSTEPYPFMENVRIEHLENNEYHWFYIAGTANSVLNFSDNAFELNDISQAFPSKNGDQHNDFMANSDRDLNQVIIRNNLMYGDGQQGIKFGKVSNVGPMIYKENIAIVNNVINTAKVLGFKSNPGSLYVSYSNFLLEFNTLWNPGGHIGTVITRPGQSAMSDMIIRNNILGAVRQDFDFNPYGVMDYNLHNTPFAYGANSVEGDPSFLGLPSFNFALSSNSNAINLADSSSHIDYDLNWNLRDATPDIGAYEYIASTLLYGDVSGDNNISAYDAALVAMHAVGLITLTDEQRIRADVTNNDAVSASDAAWIARRAVDGTIVFPVEEP